MLHFGKEAEVKDMGELFEEKVNNRLIVHKFLTEVVIKYFRTLYKQNKSVIDNANYFDLQNMNQNTKQQIIAYSKLNPPYNKLDKKVKVTSYLQYKFNNFLEKIWKSK